MIAEYSDEVYPEPKFYPDSIKLQCRHWEEVGDAIASGSLDGLGAKLISLGLGKKAVRF